METITAFRSELKTSKILLRYFLQTTEFNLTQMLTRSVVVIFLSRFLQKRILP
jgi:hypothetical protein